MSGAVYLETSILSYLAARPSRDLVSAARQQLTHDWWGRRRSQFSVYISELVIAELRAGDAAAADKRVQLVEGIDVLAITDEVTALARHLAREAGLPPKAGADALHIAIAAYHGVDYLLTWNSAHIANAELRPKVEALCRARGFEPPVLCTPDELMGN
jgi:predicted nucleic acid-binding protein